MFSLPQAIGTDVAAPFFLNALLRETQDWQHLSHNEPDQPAKIHIPLSSTQARPFNP
ncbi:hypothetical protein EDC48_107134 [Gibbsiella quercinecans]|nr:hypothetical protein EDC48_107134 [Gibbsiella quercinecans]